MKDFFSLWVFWIIQNEFGEVLLVLRNDYAFWNLPWWWLEHGEAPREWVVREVKEETGFDVKVEKLIGVYSKEWENDIVMTFLCAVIWWTMTLNNEAKEISFFSYDALPINTPPKNVERIMDFIHQNHASPVLKIQWWLSTKEWFAGLSL